MNPFNRRDLARADTRRKMMALDLDLVEKEYGTDSVVLEALKELKEEEKGEVSEDPKPDENKEEKPSEEGEVDADENKEEDPDKEKKGDPETDDTKTSETDNKEEDPSKTKDDDKKLSEEEVKKADKEKKRLTLVDSLIVNKGLTKEKAEETVSKLDSVIEAFGGDQDKLALSKVEADKMIGKQANVIRDLEARVNLIDNIDKENEVYLNGQVYSKNDVIEQFEEKYPKHCLDSETGERKEGQEIFEIAMLNLKLKTKQQLEIEQNLVNEKMSIDVTKKRNSLIESAPASLDEIKPQIRKLLDTIAPEIVLKEEFNLSGLVRLVNGSEENIQKIKDTAYAKGKADAKVVSHTNSVGNTAGNGAHSTPGLNAAEKAFYESNTSLQVAYDLKDSSDVKELRELYKKNNK